MYFLFHTGFTTIYQSNLIRIYKIFMGNSEFYIYSIIHSVKYLLGMCYCQGLDLVLRI